MINKGFVGKFYDLVIFLIFLMVVLGLATQGLSILFYFGLASIFCYFGLAIIVLLVAFRKSSEIIKVNLIFIFIITVVFVYGTEIYFILNDPAEVRISDWKKKGYDLRSRTQIYEDLRVRNKQPVFVVTPAILLSEYSTPELDKEKLFPLGGISNRLTILCNETGKWSIYKSDKYGFNNSKELYNSDIAIMLVGDSFTHGYCVDQHQTIASQLRNSYQQTISVGMGGNGELSRLASLIEYGKVFKPKTIFWIYTENTMGRVWNDISHPILEKYLTVEGYHQNLTSKQDTIDKTLMKFIDRRRQITSTTKEVIVSSVDTPSEDSSIRPTKAISKNIINFIQFKNIIYYLRSIAIPSVRKKFTKQKSIDTENELIKKIYIKAKQTTDSWGGQLVYVYLSTQALSKGSSSDHDRALKIAGEVGLNTIDTQEMMEKTDIFKINSYNGRGHYNSEGYKLIAKRLSDYLQEKKQDFEKN